MGIDGDRKNRVIVSPAVDFPLFATRRLLLLPLEPHFSQRLLCYARVFKSLRRVPRFCLTRIIEF